MYDLYLSPCKESSVARYGKKNLDCLNEERQLFFKKKFVVERDILIELLRKIIRNC